MEIKRNIERIKEQLKEHTCKLIAVSKNHGTDAIFEAYEAGQRDFGENKVQEMTEKWDLLPKDIQWHMIGHLQRNKVKYIAPFVHLIHSIDSHKLLQEVDKEAAKHQRVIDCLLQIFIAQEETKYGLSFEEAEDLLGKADKMSNIRIIGLMGMASNTENEAQIKKEFRAIKELFDSLAKRYQSRQVELKELSIGMSSDHLLAVAEGSTMVRIGSSIFGARKY